MSSIVPKVVISDVARPDVVIVGAGINGLLTAREFALAGCRVTLLERGEAGKEASWAGGGIISPLYPWRYSGPVTALASQAQLDYPVLVAQLLQETGVDAELNGCGLLMLDAHDAHEALAWAGRHGKAISTWARKDIYRHMPLLGNGWEQGLWMPHIANVRNPRLLHALLASVTRLGVHVIEQAGSVVCTQAGKVQRVLLADGRQFEAEHVVVCAGAWSRGVIEQAGVAALPAVRPVRGQMLLYRRPAGELPCIVLANGRYVIPRRDGYVLCGSTLEESGFDKSTTQDALMSLKKSAARLWPVLADESPVAHWAGLRPAAPDGIPYIGRVPGRDGLWLNAGQFRNGLVLAPASARLLVDLLLGRKTQLDPEPYQLLPPG